MADDIGNAEDRKLTSQEALNKALIKLDSIEQNTQGSAAKIRAINQSLTISPGEQVIIAFPLFGDTLEHEG